jgi:hypothetical protein
MGNALDPVAPGRNPRIRNAKRRCDGPVTGDVRRLEAHRVGDQRRDAEITSSISGGKDELAVDKALFQRKIELFLCDVFTSD